MENLFEKALRSKLRFQVKGEITLEALWSVSKDVLIEYENQLKKIVESYAQSTRRMRVSRTKEQSENELRLAIVTYIIDTFEKEEDALSINKALDKEEQELLELKHNLLQEQKKKMTIDELNAQLAAIQQRKKSV